MFFDLTFCPLVEAVAEKLPQIKAFVAMTDRKNMPYSDKIPNLLCYEDLIDAESDDFDWPEFDESRARDLKLKPLEAEFYNLQSVDRKSVV